jgi:hypothetical protein
MQEFCPVLSCVVASCAESLGISYLFTNTQTAPFILDRMDPYLVQWTGSHQISEHPVVPAHLSTLQYSLTSSQGTEPNAP